MSTTSRFKPELGTHWFVLQTTKMHLCLGTCACFHYVSTVEISSKKNEHLENKITSSTLLSANCSLSIHVTAAVSAGRGGCLKIISSLYPLKHIFKAECARKTKICLDMWQHQVRHSAQSVTRSRTCSITLLGWQLEFAYKQNVWASLAFLWKWWIWTKL